jgi:hypothetical protein
VVGFDLSQLVGFGLTTVLKQCMHRAYKSAHPPKRAVVDYENAVIG